MSLSDRLLHRSRRHTTDDTVAITIQHPAHVHFFRNVIDELDNRGYRTRVLSREKDITSRLLEEYGIPHRTLAKDAESIFQLAKTQLTYEYGILKQMRKMDPSIAVSIGEPAITHASSIFDFPSVIFTDTEHAYPLQNVITFPWADVICTPESYWDDIGPKQVRYPGYHELAYLHPNRFSPDPTVLDEVDVSKNDWIVVLRLVSWNAAHDRGQSGIGNVESLAHALERAGATVLVTSEADLPPSLSDREYDLPARKMHDLLYYADLIVGESGTMAIESALLGTPALFVSSLYAGILEELEQQYGLIFTFPREVTGETIVSRAIDLLETDDSCWRNRRQRVLDEKIDMTAFVVEILERTMAEAE